MKTHYSILSLKSSLAVFVTILSFSVLVSAEAAGFNVTGTITFEKTGDLYVSLVNEVQFNCPDDDDDEQAQGQTAVECEGEIATLQLQPNAQELQQKTIPFTFPNVPQGTYAIQVFQDVNGNGDMDEGSFGPKEPWGLSNLTKKPKLRAPKWDEVKFDVNQDVTNLTIIVK